MTSRQLLVALAVLLAGSSGCSGQKTVQVTGTVTLDGSSLANARVTFNPVGDGRMAFGNTDNEGKFELTTFNHRDGALPGKYKITVNYLGNEVEADHRIASDFKAMMSERDRLSKLRVDKPIHANYSSLNNTPLKAEVPTEGELTFKLTKSGS